MDNQPPYDKIDAFLLEELSAEEVQLFQQKIQQDTDLAKEVQVRKAMLSQLNTLGNLRDKERILRIQSKVATQQKVRRIRLSLVSIAASLLFLFVAYQWFNTQVSPQQLFAQNYEPYELSFASRSNGADKLWVDIGAFYQKEEYAQALPLLQMINSQTPIQSKVLLAIGICQLELKQYQEVISTFKKILQQPKAIYKDQAQWYLSLAYLQKNDLEQSKASLKILADDANADFHKEASALLESL